MSSAAEMADALGGKRTSQGYRTHCPAHADEHPSLDITERDGKTLFICRAGCPNQAVVDALTERGLWRTSETAGRSAQGGRRLVATYYYEDKDGCPIAYKERYDYVEDGKSAKSCPWYMMDGTLKLTDEAKSRLAASLYRGERLKATPVNVPVEVAEGEKCVDALEGLVLIRTE